MAPSEEIRKGKSEMIMQLAKEMGWEVHVISLPKEPMNWSGTPRLITDQQNIAVLED